MDNLKKLNQYDFEETSFVGLPKRISASCRAGLGLRSKHFPYLEKTPPKEAKWFEIVSENYMQSWGRPREFLHFIRRDFPVAMHGVGMSLASVEGVDRQYLGQLKSLINEIDPFIVSDHLCWTGLNHNNTHDLLPFPFTSESVDVVVNNIDQVQNYLGREILVENVSSYMTFETSEMSEKDFVNEILVRSGAKILLDLNNVYVNAINHNFDAKEYVDSIPSGCIGQMHLAGYSDMGDYLFDTHSKPVWPEVWKLFSRVIKKYPDVPFMIEWDEDIPSFPCLEDELKKAKELWSVANSYAL